ncbi:MAG: fibronectin type III domain-containing protein [Deltaproteobacteria bacterium]|nr:fibronectin type III domain-containing protein [Deltaproteobacteria bacterium]
MIKWLNTLVFSWSLLVIATASAESVSLEWDAPTLNADGTVLTDLAGYLLRQQGPSGNTLFFEVPLSAGESYAVSNLVVGKRYSFVVAAIDFSGNQSEWSNVLEVTVPDPRAPKPTPTVSPTPAPTPGGTPVERAFLLPLDFDGDGGSELVSASKATKEFQIYLAGEAPAEGGVISGSLKAAQFGVGVIKDQPGLMLIKTTRAKLRKRGAGRSAGSGKLLWQVIDPFTAKAQKWLTFGKPGDLPLYGCNSQGRAVPAVVRLAASPRSVVALYCDGKNRRIQLPYRVKETLCSSSANSTLYALQQKKRKAIVFSYDLTGKLLAKNKVPAGLKDPRLFALPSGRLGPEVLGITGTRDKAQVVALWNDKAKVWNETKLSLDAKPVKGLAVGIQQQDYRWLAILQADSLKIVSFGATVNVRTAEAVIVDNKATLANQSLRLRIR